MLLDRRALLGATGSAALLTVPSEAAEAPRGRAKADLPTPALLVDLDVFEANLLTLAEQCRKTGRGFRPHAKTHKCPEVARRQVAAGAVGICTATVAEAEAMVAAGIQGVLLTSPILEPGKIGRMADLARKPGAVMLSVGHARQVELLGEAAAARRVTLDVLIDLDVGDGRTGTLPGAPALELARLIGKSRGLRLRGMQAYSGSSSHIVGFEARQKASRQAIAQALETRELITRAGFELPILSGGSTGTYNIDTDEPGITELQVGSFIFMDMDYRRVGGKDGAVYTDFQPALTVLTTVVSASRPDRVTIDAGTKALDTTTANRPEPKGWEGLAYTRAGDEFGSVTAVGGRLPGLGDRLEFIVPHCDPTVNLYDRIHAVRGDRVEDVWPILSRRESGPVK